MACHVPQTSDGRYLDIQQQSTTDTHSGETFKDTFENTEKKRRKAKHQTKDMQQQQIYQSTTEKEATTSLLLQ